MIKIASTPSCGLFFLGGETCYRTAETYFKDLAAHQFNKTSGKLASDFCLFIWTHAPQACNMGELMEEYIKTHNLGTVTKSLKGKNPLHKEHDGAVVWTWVRDNIAFTEHCKELLCNSPSPKIAAPSTSMEQVNSTLTPHVNSLPAFGIKLQPLPEPMVAVGVAPA